MPKRSRFTVGPVQVAIRRLLAGGLIVLVGSCESDAMVEAADDAQLAVTVVLTDAAAGHRVDQGRIVLEGPTPRTLTVAPGTTETIIGLQPGSYTVVLEGLTAGVVELYGERSGINVVAGSNTPVTVGLDPFVPVLSSLPATVAAGSDITVQFSPIGAASSYSVEWDFDSEFPDATSVPTTTTTTTIRPTASGRIHVRVRAFNRLGSRGRASNSSSVDVPPLPVGLLNLSYRHACAVRNGTAYCWGQNLDFVLRPDALNSSESTPLAAPGGPYTSIFTGLSHTCGLDASGRAWCWGDNSYGGLGNGSSGAPSATPVAAAPGLTFRELALGAFHTCGLTAAGEIWCWGGYASEFGTLGDGSTGLSTTAVKAAAPAGVVFTTISAGGLNVCAVATTGDGYCWGSNVSGQIGDGTRDNRTTPTLVAGGHHFRFIDVGHVNNFFHPVCGVDTDGVAWCWGRNDSGQLGTSVTTDLCQRGSSEVECATSPQAVQGGLRFERVVPGLDHACGQTRSGRVACWGDNRYGQLGDGTRTSRSSPVELALPAGIGLIGVGHFFNCRLTPASVDCWGDSSYGQVGTGVDGHEPNPVTIPGTGWQSVTGNPCALSASGQVSCWGPLIGATSGSNTISSDVTSIGGPALHGISGTGDFACGLDQNGAAWCWGSNGVGLGDGVTDNSRMPISVAGGRTYVSISAGGNHACAVESGTGRVWCWGDNGFGQLGDNSTVNSPIPVAVASTLGFTEASAGSSFTCAVTTGTGDVFCWGYGRFGQLGFPVTVSPYTVLSPTQVPGVSSMAGLSAGVFHVCGIRSGGVTCWGRNVWGEVGTDVQPPPPDGQPPTAVPGLSGVTAVRAGTASNTCAITGSGALYCWGFPAEVPTGGNQSFNAVPTLVAGIQGAVDIAVGNTICVLAAGGRISCWGNNMGGAAGAPLPHVLSPARLPL